MNRRWFLKRLGLTPAAVALPLVGSIPNDVEITGEPGLQYYWKNNEVVGMRLDCREPGWIRIPRLIYVNGAEVGKYAVAADSYYGWVEMYDEDFKTLIPHRVEGKVEIIERTA